MFALLGGAGGIASDLIGSAASNVVGQAIQGGGGGGLGSVIGNVADTLSGGLLGGVTKTLGGLFGR